MTFDRRDGFKGLCRVILEMTLFNCRLPGGSGKRLSSEAFHSEHREAVVVSTKSIAEVAVRFLMHRAPASFLATLEGVLAGLRGETGQPTWHRRPL